MSQASDIGRPLVIACGAIAHELVAVLGANSLERAVDIQCLPAEWHNTPERITPAVTALLEEASKSGRRCFVAYGDCGTGGQLDTVLARYGAERLPGPHCYSFFAGAKRFDALAEAEIGTLWLTDYLARNFERLIIEGMGIRQHPELRDVYFAHYTRAVWLVQHHDAQTERAAEQAAQSIALPLTIEHDCMPAFSSTIEGAITPLVSA
jgi:hypothetical protein